MPDRLWITRISWDRVHLTVGIAIDGSDEPGWLEHSGAKFFLKDGGRLLPLNDVRLTPEGAEVRINVTHFNGRKQVPDGTWKFAIMEPDGEPLLAEIPLGELDLLDDASRTFMYDGNKVAYSITFGITDDDQRPSFLMRTYQTFRNPKGKRPPLPKRVVRRFKRLANRKNKTKVLKFVYRWSRRLKPPNGKRILLTSEQRDSIGGNLAQIRDRLIERGLDKRFEIRYAFRTPRTSGKRSTLRTVYLIATSDVVIVDDYYAMLDSLSMAKETKVIQVWHAGSGFKSIGYSRFGKYGSPKLSNAHRKYTHAIAGSDHLVSVYAEAFGIEESAILPTGLPRIDPFLDPDRQETARAEFYKPNPDLRDKRIILFAPTFRGRGIRDAFYDYSRIDFDQLYEACGEDTVVLFRMHHFIDEATPIQDRHRDRFFDFSDYPNGNDLLLVTDVLITDYSSIIYEFSLLERPMLFYSYDREVYAATRGFHRDYIETAPGKVCDSFDALLTALRESDFEEWRIPKFLEENFNYRDTHATDRFIDWLLLDKEIDPDRPEYTRIGAHQ